MAIDNLLKEPVTTMFSSRIRPDKTVEYEAWSRGITSATRQFPGSISVDVIRPGDSSNPEYTTLVKFDNCENLKQWNESEILKEWLEKLPDLLIGSSYAQKAEGLELWFDRPNSPIEPPYWKRVVIGVVCVYPLVILLNWALAPVTSHFHDKISLLLNVTVLSGLLTFPVMPWVTRQLRFWLYPKSGK